MEWKWKTLAGHVLTYPAPTGELAELMQWAELAVADPAITEPMMAERIYGAANPLLDHAMMPGRSMVTAETLRRPEWYVLQDMLARKDVATGRIVLEDVEARYTMPLVEAARSLGVHESALRQLVQRFRVPAWKKAGSWHFDPRTLRASVNP
jgi:hypothetical protein